jgi:peptidoglycan hydrolase-like protein with peptidoglycan-binding domain
MWFLSWYTIFIMKKSLTHLTILIISLFVVGQMTASARVVCTTLNATMSIGTKDFSSTTDVTYLQSYLHESGYLLDGSTGYFGNLTKKAVQNFQRANNITPNGTMGPITRAKIKALTCASSSSLNTESVTIKRASGMSAGASVKVATVPFVSKPVNITSAPYQGLVDGKIQIDASAVSKDYAYESCKKLIGSNLSNSVRCIWNGSDIGSSSPILQTETSPATVSAPLNTNANIVPIVPYVSLNIGPTSVPYKGGYDYFEFKSEGMRSCMLYFKDEPSSKWISAGSLGLNYTLPGYKGMENSRSYYSSCVDNNGRTVNSNTILISVSNT